MTGPDRHLVTRDNATRDNANRDRANRDRVNRGSGADDQPDPDITVQAARVTASPQRAPALSATGRADEELAP